MRVDQENIWAKNHQQLQAWVPFLLCHRVLITTIIIYKKREFSHYNSDIFLQNIILPRKGSIRKKRERERNYFRALFFPSSSLIHLSHLNSSILDSGLEVGESKNTTDRRTNTRTLGQTYRLTKRTSKGCGLISCYVLYFSSSFFSSMDAFSLLLFPPTWPNISQFRSLVIPRATFLSYI